MGVLTELNRRQVFKVVVIYAAVAWSCTEALSYLVDVFQLPGWSERLVAYGFLLGFPAAAMLAWKYDIRGGTGPLPSFRPVAVSVAVVLTLAGGLAYLLPGRVVPTVVAFAPPPNSLAVLPLANHSRGAADAYFGEALTDELINAFSRVPHLLITGRTSVDAVVGAGLDLKQIGRRLNVGHLLEGSVRVEGAHTQISVQLVNTHDGFEVWSQEYDKELSDLSEVQQAIGQAIVASTAPELIAKSDIGRVFKAAGCQVIYPMYMRAAYLREHHGKKTREERQPDRQRALELMQEATEISPGCALAWDGLIASYKRTCSPCNDRVEQQELYTAIVPLAHKAIKLNPDLPKPWLTLAHYAELERRWIDAEELTLKALARAPNDAEILANYADDIAGRGRIHEALEVLLRAYQLDPLNWMVTYLLPVFAVMANEPDIALKYARITGGIVEPADAYLLRGEVQKALDLYRPHFYADDQKPTSTRWLPAWYGSCLEAKMEPRQVGVARKAYRQAYAHLDDPVAFRRSTSFETWWIKSCAMYLGDADWLAPKMLGEPPFELTHEDNLMVFWASASKWSSAGKSMRANPVFHRFAADVGLLDYWRRFGWPDMCQPAGGGFVCD